MVQTPGIAEYTQRCIKNHAQRRWEYLRRSRFNWETNWSVKDSLRRKDQELFDWQWKNKCKWVRCQESAQQRNRCQID